MPNQHDLDDMAADIMSQLDRFTDSLRAFLNVVVPDDDDDMSPPQGGPEVATAGGYDPGFTPSHGTAQPDESGLPGTVEDR
jgi:hypothetical protein